MELALTLRLPDELYRELIDAALECRCSPKIFAAESVESVLASRRLPKVEAGRNGAQIGRIAAVEDTDTEPEGYCVSIENERAL